MADPPAKRHCDDASAVAVGEPASEMKRTADGVDGRQTVGGTPELEGFKFEYLDHTADVQVHSWGTNLKESFEQVVLGMFGYMTELDKVAVDESETMEFEVEGHDLDTLLFALMDEFLFRFSTEPYVVCREVKIIDLDLVNFKIKVQGKGEVFDLKKHPQGTEVKAITYSEMQIHQTKTTHDVYVIIDI